MVDKVFCYSKEEALKNGNKLSVISILLSIVIFIILVILLAYFLNDSMMLFMILFFTFITVVVYFSVILGLRLRSLLCGYASDINGNIYKIMKLNNGQYLGIGGYSAGSLIDNIANNGSNIGRNLGGSVGALAQIYRMKKSAEIMRNPENITKMVENSSNITGVEIYQILKVNSYTENKHNLKIKCDYKVMRNDKVKNNKTITVEKSYKDFADLKSLLINKH